MVSGPMENPTRARTNPAVGPQSSVRNRARWSRLFIMLSLDLWVDFVNLGMKGNC